MDPHDRPPKTEDLLAELTRVIDSIQLVVPEGLSPYSVRKILRKLEGPPSVTSSLTRTRNISDGGHRSSVEIDDEQSGTISRSVYGLDTSAIDATTMLSSDSAYKDLSELLMPSQRIVGLHYTTDYTNNFILRTKYASPYSSKLIFYSVS